MKKELKILFLSILLFGCNNIAKNSSSSQTSNQSSVSITTSSTSSFQNSQYSSIISTSSTSNESTSSNFSSSSSSFDNNNQNKQKTIKEIKETAKNYCGLVNSVGVYESNEKVELELSLIACLDAVTTKSGYGDRYKILMSDGIDYIYLKTNYDNYSYLKKYINDYGVYKIKGNISLYNGEVEITVDEKPTYLEEKSIDIQYDKLAENKSLEEVYQDLYSLKLNCKGIAFSKVVGVEVVCLAKDINNTNLYFGADGKIINLHGNDKVTNNFTVGSSYLLYGALNMHNFRPGLEYVYATKLDNNVNFSLENIETMTASSFYNYKYETDKDASYPNYSKLFEKPYKITGYVNSYLKDNKEYIVFEDNYKDQYYSTYQNASSAKAIFFVNENYTGLTSSNTQYCPIYEYIDLGTKLEVVVFPYLWNTQKYPQVYCYSFNEV